MVANKEIVLKVKVNTARGWQQRQAVSRINFPSMNGFVERPLPQGMIWLMYLGLILHRTLMLCCCTKHPAMLWEVSEFKKGKGNVEPLQKRYESWKSRKCEKETWYNSLLIVLSISWSRDGLWKVSLTASNIPSFLMTPISWYQS